MRRLHILSDSKGLTLVELMIVLVLSLLLMAAVYMTYQLQQSTGQSQLQVAAAQQDVRAMMDIISYDIMHAGLDPSLSQNIQGIPANSSSAATLRVAMDLNSDGNANGQEENITFRRTGSTLERVDNNMGVTRSLANNVTQMTFRYYNASHALINPTGTVVAGLNTLNATEAAQVKYVDVTIEKRSDEVDPQSGQFITRTLQRTICRRNGV
jgi:prepilin-type N-terminal cleavage/methylation domain-containing protein